MERLVSVTRKLLPDPEAYEKYKKTFQTYMRDGEIRRIPERRC